MSGAQTSTPQVIDFRLMEVSFAVNGQLKTFNQGLTIRAKGQKFANPLQNTCTVEIANLDKDTRNFILTETSPFTKSSSPKTMTVSVGRVSTGLFQVYSGEITTSKISQPPDIMLLLKCGTLHSKRGSVGSRTGGGKQTLAQIAAGVAANIGVSLNNQAKARTIGNYAYNGNALGEVSKLQETGVDAYIDDNQLVLKEVGVALSGDAILLSDTSGLIGVPEVTEKGLKCTFLFNNLAKLGGALQIESTLNPAANGLFVIYKLNFNFTSRELPFYYIAECVKAKS